MWMMLSLEKETKNRLTICTPKDIFKEGGFNLRKFVTNVPSLQLRIDEQEKQPVLLNEQSPVSHSEETYTKATLAPSQPVQTGEQKILGVCWNVEQDQLLFGLTSIAQQASQLEPTKQNIVSVVGRFVILWVFSL